MCFHVIHFIYSWLIGRIEGVLSADVGNGNRVTGSHVCGHTALHFLHVHHTVCPLFTTGFLLYFIVTVCCCFLVSLFFSVFLFSPGFLLLCIYSFEIDITLYLYSFSYFSHSDCAAIRSTSSTQPITSQRAIPAKTIWTHTLAGLSNNLRLGTTYDACWGSWMNRKNVHQMKISFPNAIEILEKFVCLECSVRCWE
jgi:hypothetical protein